MDREHLERVLQRAGEHGGVISRTLLRDLGVGKDRVRRELDAGRWTRLGRQTLLPHRGGVSAEGLRWRAVWETGAGVTVLDGVTALQAAGLRHFTEDEVCVSVVHRHRVSPPTGVRLRRVIRRLPGEVVPAGVPRTRAPSRQCGRPTGPPRTGRRPWCC